MKREIPLFVIDKNREHKLGEADFVVCTDIDNGFVAKISYIDGNISEQGDDYKVVSNGQGISAKLEIKRVIGKNPKTSAIRTLVSKAMAYYEEISVVKVDFKKITTEKCVKFLDIMIADGMRQADDSGSDFNRRITILQSVEMFQAIKQKLENNNL